MLRWATVWSALWVCAACGTETVPGPPDTGPDASAGEWSATQNQAGCGIDAAGGWLAAYLPLAA